MAASDPLTAVNNLSTFIFSLIRAIGLILLGWGVVQVGLSFQSHDPSQRSQGFLTLAGGLVVTFAKEILDLITAWLEKKWKVLLDFFQKIVGLRGKAPHRFPQKAESCSLCLGRKLFIEKRNHELACQFMIYWLF